MRLSCKLAVEEEDDCIYYFNCTVFTYIYMYVCIYIYTVKRQSRLSFHVFVAVPMGRAFFRCRLF